MFTNFAPISFRACARESVANVNLIENGAELSTRFSRLRKYFQVLLYILKLYKLSFEIFR